MSERFRIIIIIIIIIMALFAWGLSACGDSREPDGAVSLLPGADVDVTERAAAPVDSDAVGERTTVRFYYHSREIDPNVELLPEAYLYNPEEIPTEQFRDEFIRLLYVHTDITACDLWFDGDRLYIDLHEDENSHFNRGSTGSADRGIRLYKTLASVPGIASFEVHVGGIRGAYTSHFSFYYVVLVEDGEIVGYEEFEPFDY